MTEPFIGEIRLAAFGIAPKGWALCNGQLLPINQNQALFSILGTTYGGDGRVNFALPDLRGRAPLHAGNNVTLGQRLGEESHMLNINEMPRHAHIANGTGAIADSGQPNGALWASNTGQSPYSSAANVQMAPNAIEAAGGNQPHDNMSPYLTVNFIIALVGIFPPRN
jgi:microcystin-dependent protein